MIDIRMCDVRCATSKQELKTLTVNLHGLVLGPTREAFTFVVVPNACAPHRGDELHRLLYTVGSDVNEYEYELKNEMNEGEAEKFRCQVYISRGRKEALRG